MVSFGHSMKTAVRKWLVEECMKTMGKESRMPYAIITDLVKENEDKFIALNVNIYNLGSHSVPKGAAALCISGFTVAPPTTNIFLRKVFLIVNLKIFYLQYEVSGDKFCVQTGTGIELTP